MAQQREGSTGNPSRASPRLRRRCGDRAMVKKWRWRRNSTAAVLQLRGRGKVRGGGEVKAGGGVSVYRGHEAMGRGCNRWIKAEVMTVV
jgi:hypothetical protein